MNRAMRADETNFRRRPVAVDRHARQPAPLTARTRGFARHASQYYDPRQRQIRPTGRENTSKQTLFRERFSSFK